MGELFAGDNGMKCEAIPHCSGRTWTIVLTDEESSRLPEDNPSLFIFQNKLGVATCNICAVFLS